MLGDDRGAVAVALLPYVQLPTAQSGLGNGSVEGGLILPISISAPGGFTVIVMPEGDYLKDTSGNGYHGAFDFLINVSHPIDKRWTFYSEVFTSQPFEPQDKPIYTLDEALTCALTPNLQLDFGGNFSLNSVAPRTQLYVGLSQRY
ncbi:MAG: transporter [Steroidobacteraceae bacterium]